MTNKVTKREVINAMLNEDVIKNNDNYVAYLENELALINKKYSAKKTTKNQEENVGIKEVILASLTEKGVTVTDLQNQSAELANYSNQRISALLRQLVDSGKVVRTSDKRKSYFSLPVVADTE